MTDLVPRQSDATSTAYDAATLAVLAAMGEAARRLRRTSAKVERQCT